MVTDPNIIGMGIVLAFTALVLLVVHLSRLPGIVKLLVYAGVGLRFVGAVGRESIAMDANVYLRWGRRYAEQFQSFDFSPFYDPAYWRGGSWLGTNFVGYPTGLIISIVGPGRMAAFFGFALFAFIGILAFAYAYRRAFPKASYVGYWAWIFLFPSLWFWPSSVGKEAIMLVGLGIATLGFVGKNDRVNWPVMAIGLFFVFAIRPPVAAVFAFAMILAYWLNFKDWSLSRMAQGIVMMVLGLGGMYYALSTTLEGDVGLDSLESYVDGNAARNDYGGSSIEGVGASPSGIPAAMRNVLFRPFPWEARNMASLFSAMEILLMWGLIFFRRRQLGAALKEWRSHRVLRFVIPFALLYVIALGMNLSNLGLMARQRTLVFPFLFFIVEAGGAILKARREKAGEREEELATAA